MDAILHTQRLATGAAALRIFARDIAALPDGAIIDSEGHFLARNGGAFLKWSFEGYANAATPEAAILVTPPATVTALRAGYRPAWHPSA